MIYKPSNFSPNLEEIDASPGVNNVFSCMINTSGEPVKAYKMSILSEDGSKIIYEPTNPTELTIPVKNKSTLKIKGVNQSLIGSDFVNDKNYQWGIRVYNAPVGSTLKPNTVVCNGYIVGSTKYVVWAQIPSENSKGYNDTEKTNGQKACDQLSYDRYIEFTNIDPSNLVKGAKDDKELEYPTSSYTERQKIDWVSKELGTNLDYVKIEAEESFKYNFKDGVAFNIYQCSDKHTVNSCFADPNSNINVSNLIMIYDNQTAANNAKNAGDNPSSITVTMASCMKKTDGTYSARKITGYSSDTGEIRNTDSYSEPPKNGYYYRLFKANVLTTPATYEAVDDENLASHVIGGTPITDSYFKIKSNLISGNTKRLFIQPNINIKTDDTNPNEIVFDNGCRIDIIKQTMTSSSGELIDITFNKLDNTQWLLEGDAILIASGSIPLERGIIQPQTDYTVYTDFADSIPYSIFYARKSPILTIQMRDALHTTIEGTLKDDGIFYDLEDNPVEGSDFYIYHDNNPELEREESYYKYNILSREYYVSFPWITVEGREEGEKITDIPPEGFNEVEFTCLWQNEDGETVLNPQIKSYKFVLYAYDADYRNLTLVKESEEYYNTDVNWTFRGLDGIPKSNVYTNFHPHAYCIEVIVTDEYDKVYSLSKEFTIIYKINESPLPIGINLDCKEHAFDIEINAPAYAKTTDDEEYETITANDIKNAQAVIDMEHILNYTQLATEDIDLVFPIDFYYFTQFQITKDFINNIPPTTASSLSDVEIGRSDLLEIRHKASDDLLIQADTKCYLRTIPIGTTYYLDEDCTEEAGSLTEVVIIYNFLGREHSEIKINGNSYYINNIEGPQIDEDITEDIYLQENSIGSTIVIDNVEYYVLTDDIILDLETLTFKLSNFDAFYNYNDGTNNYVRRNPDQYYLRLYKKNKFGVEEQLDNCFKVLNNLQGFVDIINPEDDGSYQTTITNALRNKRSQGSQFDVEYEILNPSILPSEGIDGKLYILQQSCVLYGITYQPGIYEYNQIAETWELSSKNDFVFIEETENVMDAEGHTEDTYSDLLVPSVLQKDDGESGEVWYAPSETMENDLEWIDTGITISKYQDALYDKWVNLFCKVQNGNVVCEVSIENEL